MDEEESVRKDFIEVFQMGWDAIFGMMLWWVIIPIMRFIPSNDYHNWKEVWDDHWKFVRRDWNK